MKEEGGRMKEMLLGLPFILHPSYFRLALAPSLTVGLPPVNNCREEGKRHEKNSVLVSRHLVTPVQ
jgi:hypothetical protein